MIIILLCVNLAHSWAGVFMFGHDRIQFKKSFLITFMNKYNLSDNVGLIGF